MSFHNRRKKKEKAFEEFVSKKFQNDPYYCDIVKEAATIYRQWVPEQKSQVNASQAPPSVSANSVVIISNISVRISTVYETEEKAISPSATNVANVFATLSNDNDENDEDSETVLEEGVVSKDFSIEQSSQHSLRSRSSMDGDNKSSSDAKRKSTDESSIRNSVKKKQKK
jgi:hypothetical protein